MKCLRNQPLGLVGNVLRCHDCARAHHWFGHFAKKIVLTIAKGMMDKCASRLGGHVRHPNQVKHWYVLSVCAGDRIDRTEFTDSIGCADRADAMDTCVTIGRITRVELVATTNPFDFSRLHDGIIHRKCEVACNAKDFRYANGIKACENVLNNCSHLISSRDLRLPIVSSSYLSTLAI
jgi:hypothetical protein